MSRPSGSPKPWPETHADGRAAGARLPARRVAGGWIQGLAAAAALLAAACGGQETAAEPTEPGPRRVINVQVQVLRREGFTEVIRTTGTVVADRVVTVAAEEAGPVVAVLADKGDRVEAGQVLVRLNDELLRAQRDEARAQADLAAQLWARVRRLYELDGIGTESDYLQARYGDDGARARLALMQARLQRTVVRAPFAGVLATRHVEVGTMVAPGTPVADLLDLEPLQVSAGVPERYAADVSVGSRARVVFPSLGDTSDARVSYVGTAVDRGNRTFAVELDLEAPPAAVKPQMVVEVVLVRRTLPAAVVVPRQALVRGEDGFTAFVVTAGDDGEVAARRRVRLGPSSGDGVVVTEGLTTADRLVVVGQQQVADGDHVRVVGGP